MQAPNQTALKFTEHHSTFLEIITENIPVFFSDCIGLNGREDMLSLLLYTLSSNFSGYYLIIEL